MSEKRIVVDIADLYLYTNNPRFEDIADSQRDAILKLVEQQADKIIKLANDIAENGLSALDSIAIMRDDEHHYIVREGNRRITAIKLLSQPNIVEGIKGVYEKFKYLNKIFTKNPIISVECVLFDDENKLNKWIELRHTGENGGVGLTTWNTMQKRRFDESLGNRSLATDAVDFIINNDKIDKNIKDNLHKISITNLERLFSDPYVKAELGISYKLGEPFIVDTENSDKFLLFDYVLRDMIFNANFKVSIIYNKENRKDYINTVKNAVFSVESNNAVNKPIRNSDIIVKPIGNTSNSNIESLMQTQISDYSNNSIDNDSGKKNIIATDNPLVNDSGTATSIPVQNADITSGISKNNSIPAKTTVKAVPLSTARKTLIPSGYKLSIKQPRLNKIYNELKSLSIDDFPNAGAVLFRIFVELGFDYYASIKNINSYSKEKDSLTEKNRKVSTYMKNNNIITDKECKTIEMLSSVPQDKTSINTFNAYVHNGDASPISTDLKIAWDTIGDFIFKLYSSI